MNHPFIYRSLFNYALLLFIFSPIVSAILLFVGWMGYEIKRAEREI